MNTGYVYQGAQVGEFRNSLLWAAGPASYSQTTGDLVYNPGANEYINFPSNCTSKSGLYTVVFIPAAVGQGIIRAGAPSPSQSGWTARWLYASFGATGSAIGVDSVAINAGGTGGSNGTANISATGGGGTGAVIQTVTAGGIVTSVKLISSGTGYTSIPTFTPAAGNATFTVTIGSNVGAEVATGTNLSAELVMFGALESQL